jgi:LysM repeat protein
MKSVLLTAGFIVISFFASAQQKVVAVASTKGFAIEHKVAAKETLSFLSRKYNVKVSEIASANKFATDKNLSLGETVKIPLLASNFNQKNKKGIPVFYTTVAGEGLLSVSKKFNNVPLKTLKEWNNLKTDAIPKNKTLVVGYLNAAAVSVSDKTETPKKEEKPKEAAVKSEQKIEPVIVMEEIIRLDSIAVAVEPIDETGFFKKYFNPQNDSTLIVNRNLISGIFKTEAGRNDKKYYILIDDVPVGAIVKVSNLQNEKYIYAKVLGNMREVKYSEGFDMRISETAATILQIGDLERFEVSVSYVN